MASEITSEFLDYETVYNCIFRFATLLVFDIEYCNQR